VTPFEETSESERRRRGIYLLPALLTTGNLFFGFYALISAIHGEFRQAGIGIIIAGLFDGLDGRIARLTKTTSQFGIEYDSLSDMVSFGLAPAIILYTWALQPFGKLGWLAAFLYAACAALRLARFNVQSDTEEKRWFVGIPSPGAAAVVCTSILFFGEVGDNPAFRHLYVPLLISLLALLMVSRVRYRSLKQIDLRHPHSSWVLVGIVLAVIIIAAEPVKTLFLLAIAYALSGPVEAALFVRRRQQARVLDRLREAGKSTPIR
jgi:CDP-diacylglycerol--serine O-phosphatidyltransferase